MKQINFPLCALFLGITALMGCKKMSETDDSAAISSVNSGGSSDAKAVNGILVFANTEAFDKTLQTLYAKKPTELADYSKEHHFKSQANVFYNVVCAEKQHQAKYAGKSSTELSALTTQEKHSDLFWHHVNETKLIRLTDGSEGYTYDYTICKPEFANLLNEQGFIQIGNALHHYSATTHKIWEGANPSDAQALLNTNISDSKRGILVMAERNIFEDVPNTAERPVAAAENWYQQWPSNGTTCNHGWSEGWTNFRVRQRCAMRSRGQLDPLGTTHYSSYAYTSFLTKEIQNIFGGWDTHYDHAVWLWGGWNWTGHSSATVNTCSTGSGSATFYKVWPTFGNSYIALSIVTGLATNTSSNLAAFNLSSVGPNVAGSTWWSNKSNCGIGYYGTATAPKISNVKWRPAMTNGDNWLSDCN